MFTTLVFLPLLALLVSAQTTLSIDTPTLVQCQPTQITWTDTGNSPYDLLIVPANDMCGQALEDLGNQTCSAVTWIVNLAAGTQVVLSLVDAAGDEAWSGAITVANSSDTSCLNGTALASASSPSSASPVAGPLLTVPPSGSDATASTSAAKPTSSAFAPAGAANAGLGSASGALSMRPLSTFTLFSSAALAVIAFAF